MSHFEDGPWRVGGCFFAQRRGQRPVANPTRAAAAKHFFRCDFMGGRGSGGHNRKSATRKRVEGNAGKRTPRRPRKRKTSLPPVALQYNGPLGAAPSHLKPAQEEVWNELSAIIPAGVAQASDRWAFELLVCLMAKFRRGAAKASEANQILSQLARFGMTPSDRDRVRPNLPPQSPTTMAPADPWAKFNLPARNQ